ncbi:MAG: phospho-sugar mutase [Oscillospiraceae bacterium]|nr:phospho-sugar mutase [Oscillospiraceae bacterium]
MNCHVVGLATQGLLNYLKKEYNIKEEDIKEIKDDTKEIKNKIKNIINKNQKLRICISYDTRNYSREFALQAARVLLANGAEVLVYARHRPTPMLSFAVREYKAHAGIMITASHNPSEDNGYKAYNATGGQITDAASKAVEAEIGLLDVFEVYERCKNTSLESIRWLGAETDRLYYDRISEWLPRREDAKLHGGALRMIYTPLHGAGYVPVTDMLERLGYTSYTVVEEQREPDGDFPTVQKPNPEEKAVFEKALALAETACPDILFATDPDADRIGVLARDSAGSCLPLTGNQLGALLCAYLIEARGEGLLGGMPANPAVVTTIVTGTLAENICRANGVAVELVLTGFKYIGEKMDQWLATGERSFLFGFEESYGYLTGDVCRDKDAVISAALVAEMALHYKRRGMNLHEALQALYETYGAVSDALINLEARGAEGQAFILALMEDLRANAAGALPGETVVAVEDFRTGVRTDLAGNVRSAIHLPSSNVLKLFLADGSWVALRPSGTEPKIKLYLCCPGKTIAEADRRCAELRKKAETLLGIL